MKKIVAATVALLKFGVSGAVAATFSLSTTAPTINANDVGYLGYDNPIAPNSDAYVASNGAAFGQTFTTPLAAAAYNLTAVTFRIDGGSDGSTNGVNVYSNSTINLRVSLAGALNTLVTTATDSVVIPGNTPPLGTNNNPPFYNGYITFTLATPVALLPGTSYAFDLDGTAASSGFYFPLDGTTNDGYAGGVSYVSGSGGAGAATYTPTSTIADRTFVASLTAVPEPASFGMLAFGLVGLLKRRRTAQ